MGIEGSANIKAQKLYIAFKNQKQSLLKDLSLRKELVTSVAPIAERKEAISGATIVAVAQKKEAISGAAIVAVAEENPFVRNFFDNVSLIVNTIGASCQRKDNLRQ